MKTKKKKERGPTGDVATEGGGGRRRHGTGDSREKGQEQPRRRRGRADAGVSESPSQAAGADAVEQSRGGRHRRNVALAGRVSNLGGRGRVIGFQLGLRVWRERGGGGEDRAGGVVGWGRGFVNFLGVWVFFYSVVGYPIGLFGYPYHTETRTDLFYQVFGKHEPDFLPELSRTV
ncbi:UNVERIFIED_CONTAM: hypothetical protein Sradi_3018400 [Sesamum radiatum]|uniref:Uncharacterized protein n=1 Tax=Sesamum radiatum TaxID=300843 RepID=A0AAW2S169_SESRA